MMHKWEAKKLNVLTAHRHLELELELELELIYFT